MLTGSRFRLRDVQRRHVRGGAADADVCVCDGRNHGAVVFVVCEWVPGLCIILSVTPKEPHQEAGMVLMTGKRSANGRHWLFGRSCSATLGGRSCCLDGHVLQEPVSYGQGGNAKEEVAW